MKKEPRTAGNLFANDANSKARCFYDYKKIKTLTSHLKGIGLRIVLTQGTFDMAHIGHCRYLEEAQQQGDFLIVGVDSDKKVRVRKGPDRPVVPEEERLEMLTHLRSVNAVFLKELGAPKWALIKAVEPDVLVATKETYSDKQIKELGAYCGEVIVLEPMATTSTSAKIRLLQIGTAKKLEEALTPRLIQTIQDVLGGVKNEKPKHHVKK